jgi:hypothetical protein
MAVIEAIETIYLEAAVTTVTTATLPTTFEHLQIRASLRGDRAGSQQLYFRPNSDSTADKNFQIMEGYATTVSALGAFDAYTYFNLREMPYRDSDAAAYGTYIIDILDYRNTSKNTTIMWTAGMNGVVGTDPNRMVFGGGVWDNTAAVTSLFFHTISDEFSRGSCFTIYGITG